MFTWAANDDEWNQIISLINKLKTGKYYLIQLKSKTSSTIRQCIPYLNNNNSLMLFAYWDKTYRGVFYVPTIYSRNVQIGYMTITLP